MVLKGLYIILLGIFLTMFVAIGIATFYPEPAYQTPQSCLTPAVTKQAPSEIDHNVLNKECERSQNKLNEARSVYVQIISSISLVGAVIFLVLALTLVKKIDIFSHGFLFGSIFTLLYSVGRGLGSSQPQFKFILISLSLILVMGIGYIRFINESGKK